MPYKVYKMGMDRRNNTCGFFIPNGGFYHVVEMTFENHKQLSNLSQRQGYSVDLVDGPVGFFDAEGYEVDPASIEVHPISKTVTGYKKKSRMYRGKETSKKAEHTDVERPGVVAQAALIGIPGKTWSTQTLKQQINAAGRSHQRTLAVTE